MTARIPTSMSPAEVTHLAELAFGRTVLELGSYLGHSTVAMAKVARVVHAVDWFRGDPHAGDEETVHPFLDNLHLNDVRDNVVVHVGRIEDVLPKLRPESFDFAFHDAYHTAEAVARDLRLLAPLMKRGRLIALHDYGIFGVKEAVDASGFEQVELTETLVVIRV